LEHGGAKLKARRGLLAGGLEGETMHMGNWKMVVASR
jgi:hypothetical protein